MRAPRACGQWGRPRNEQSPRQIMCQGSRRVRILHDASYRAELRVEKDTLRRRDVKLRLRKGVAVVGRSTDSPTHGGLLHRARLGFHDPRIPRSPCRLHPAERYRTRGPLPQVEYGCDLESSGRTGSGSWHRRNVVGGAKHAASLSPAGNSSRARRCGSLLSSFRCVPLRRAELSCVYSADTRCYSSFCFFDVCLCSLGLVRPLIDRPQHIRLLRDRCDW